MASSEYKILQQLDSDTEGQVPRSSPLEQSPRTINKTCTCLIILLLTSLSFNAVWVYQQLYASSESINGVPTVYSKKFECSLASAGTTLTKIPTAGLVRNVAVPFTSKNEYISSNRTIQDEAWKSARLVPDQGLVALTDDYVRSKGLPTAQRFPWDKSKGLYILNGFHDMHCLVRITTRRLGIY